MHLFRYNAFVSMRYVRYSHTHIHTYEICLNFKYTSWNEYSVYHYFYVVCVRELHFIWFNYYLSSVVLSTVWDLHLNNFYIKFIGKLLSDAERFRKHMHLLVFAAEEKIGNRSWGSETKDSYLRVTDGKPECWWVKGHHTDIDYATLPPHHNFH